MKAVSDKQGKLNRVRAVRVAEMKAEQTWCSRCGQNTHTDGHERPGRVHGADITDPDDLLCRPCNGWAEDNPRLAAWDGWKVSGKNPRDPVLLPSEARDNLGDVVKTQVVVK